jgi:hypothetical protein
VRQGETKRSLSDGWRIPLISHGMSGRIGPESPLFADERR